jgi:hypothetical protein
MGTIFPFSLAIGMGVNGVQMIRNCLSNITSYEAYKGGFNIFDTASPTGNAE